MNLNNYVAVITGGASGIGEATVRLFIERGAKVVIVDLNEERGSALEAELGERAWFYKADVSDSAQVQAMFQAIEEKYGVVDVLYNNAAYSLSKTLWDTTEEDWDRVMRVNLKGYFLCAKYALPLMKKSSHGSIICTGSELGVVGCVESLAYNTSRVGSFNLQRAWLWSWLPSVSASTWSAPPARKHPHLSRICPEPAIMRRRLPV